MQRIPSWLERNFSRQESEWADILRFPGMLPLTRLTIAAGCVAISYGHWVSPHGFRPLRWLVYACIMVVLIRMLLTLPHVKKYHGLVLAYLIDLYYLVCLASCILLSDEPPIMADIPATLAYLPAMIVMNSFFMATSAAIRVQASLTLMCCAALGIFMWAPHATPGWNEYKNIALCTMAASFATLLLAHELMRGMQINTILLERVQEAQLKQTLEREREQFRADLARLNRVYIIETMALTLAHEISQPINSTSVFLGATRRWLHRDKPNVEEALQATDKAAQQIERAREIILSIRGFVKKGGTEREPIDLVETLEDALALMRKELDFRNVRIFFEPPRLQQPILVLALKHEVQQIIVNLLMNSMEAFVQEDDRRITVSLANPSNASVDVRIEDNGPGFPLELKPEIFSRFVTTKEYGTGLGLSICVGLAEKFGGQLELDSVPGKGTVALLRLPVVATNSS